MNLLPRSESLKMTVNRVIPYWTKVIEPSLKEGKKIIVVAHGNSLRAMVKHLTGMDDNEIMQFELMTAAPFVFKFDSNFKPIGYRFLLSEEQIKERLEK